MNTPTTTNIDPESGQAELALVSANERQAIKETRLEMIQQALAPAYGRASMLNIQPEESTKLAAPFPDTAVRGGAKGKAELLYIPHIHLSDRLNGVLGIGQWALIRRAEKLGETVATSTGGKMQRIYADCVLLIRGAVAAEAIGVGTYHPNNPNEDYSSGVEQAVSDALTRCCKRLSIGSQVWDPAHNEQWLARKRTGGQATGTAPAARPYDLKPEAAKPAPKPAPESPVEIIQKEIAGSGISDAILAKAMAEAFKVEPLPDWRHYPHSDLVRAAKPRAWSSLMAIVGKLQSEQAQANPDEAGDGPDGDDSVNLFGE